MADRKYNLDRKSGLYFIVFIIIVAIILVFYFSSENNNSTSNSNINNVNSVVNNNNNKKVDTANKNDNINEANANVNVANTNSAIGGTNLNQAVDSLNIEISGYPNLVRTENGEIINLDFGDNNSVNIMPLDYEGMVRNSIGVKNEETIVVGGVPGKKLTGSSAKDGAAVNLILVQYKNRLYHFSGNDSYLNNLNNFIKFQ